MAVVLGDGYTVWNSSIVNPVILLAGGRTVKCITTARTHFKREFCDEAKCTRFAIGLVKSETLKLLHSFAKLLRLELAVIQSE